MAGILVAVCLPAVGADDFRALLKDALEPFGPGSDLAQEEGSLWDSWRVGGAADGLGFWIRPGCGGEPGIIHDDAGFEKPATESWPGMCAGGPRHALDFEEYAAATLLAGRIWDLWQRLGEQYPPLKPLSHFYAEHGVDPGGPIWPQRQALADYLTQPIVEAFFDGYPIPLDRQTVMGAPVVRAVLPGEYTGTREQFVRSWGPRGQVRRAVLTLDGWWIDDDGKAFHAECADPAACDHTPSFPEGPQGNEDYLRSLAPDSVVVSVRGHG
jgi:hypothetical protein